MQSVSKVKRITTVTKPRGELHFPLGRSSQRNSSRFSSQGNSLHLLFSTRVRSVLKNGIIQEKFAGVVVIVAAAEDCYRWKPRPRFIHIYHANYTAERRDPHYDAWKIHEKGGESWKRIYIIPPLISIVKKDSEYSRKAGGVITKLKEGEKERRMEKIYSFYKEDVRERASKLYNGFSSFYKARLSWGEVERVLDTIERHVWNIHGAARVHPFGYSESKVERQGISVGVSPPMESLVFERGCKLWTRLVRSDALVRNRISDKFLGKLEGTGLQINHSMKRGWMEIKFRAC